jgi:hypothetical protein
LGHQGKALVDELVQGRWGFEVVDVLGDAVDVGQVRLFGLSHDVTLDWWDAAPSKGQWVANNGRSQRENENGGRYWGFGSKASNIPLWPARSLSARSWVPEVVTFTSLIIDRPEPRNIDPALLHLRGPGGTQWPGNGVRPTWETACKSSATRVWAR